LGDNLTQDATTAKTEAASPRSEPVPDHHKLTGIKKARDALASVL